VGDDADLVRKVLEAWNRRDMEAIAQHLHPDFEWVEHDAWLHSVPARSGMSAVSEVTEGLEEGFNDYRAEVVDVVAVDAERVVAITRETGSGIASGAAFSTEFGYVVTVRAGRLARVEAYRDPREAFAAVGHSEDGSGA
jgi:ketosteroid isomerase-like protein